MWYEATKYKPQKIEDINEYVKSLKGELEDREAKITLAKFFKLLIAIIQKL